METTSHKAWVAGIAPAVVLVALYFLAPVLGFKAPPVEDLKGAITAILTLGVTGGLSAVATYVVPNRPK